MPLPLFNWRCCVANPQLKPKPSSPAMFCCMRLRPRVAPVHLTISNPFKLRRGLCKRRVFIKKRRSAKWNLGSKTRRFFRNILAACTCSDTSSVTASDSDGTIVSTRNHSFFPSTATNTIISDTATMIQGEPEPQPKWTGLRPILSAERIAELMPIPPRPMSLVPVESEPFPTITTTRPETPPAESRLSLPLEAYITPLSPPPRRRKRVLQSTETTSS
ncbi:hypothetical protein BDZ89DRAFT_1170807 [Hymenopellis radicata]|nr:hypothetical protein BDZ89DRAFT_1170807 [Hymenopellis radicata]